MTDDQRDVPNGEVRWIEGSGWCDQPFVGLILHPVQKPTAGQIRYVQGLHGYRDKNYLEIRDILRKGGDVAFGLLLPRDVQELDARLRELGLAYSVTKESIYRPLPDASKGNPDAT